MLTRPLGILAFATLLMAQDDLDALASLLDDVTYEVTQERLNVDYTPSVISVIDHHTMRALGLKTLFDTLSILPGVETMINQVGTRKVIVRGFDNPNNFTFDKIKLIVDGVPIETALFGNTNYYRDLPTDLIDRIEVLRGPASALYGTGGFNGVINVVTRHRERDGSEIFTGGGSFGYVMGGTRVQYALDDRTRLQMEAYLQRSDKQLLLYPRLQFNFGSNMLDPATQQPIPEPYDVYTNEQLSDHGFAARLEHDGLTAMFRLKDRTSGNYYGWNEYFELDTTRRNREQYLFAQLGYESAVAARTQWLVTVGYSHYQIGFDAQDFAPFSGFKVPYDFTMKEAEESYRAETIVQSRAAAGHFLEAGVMLQRQQLVYSDIDDAVSPYGLRDLVTPRLHRDVAALYARDTFEISQQVSLLMAARADHYAAEHRVFPSYQAGLLYTPMRGFQLKLNYGHAFRVPSWIEGQTVAYGPNDGVRPGNGALSPETTDTYEVIVIMTPGEGHHLQLNAYYSTIDDVIDIDDTGTSADNDNYANWPERTSMGVEAAYGVKPYTAGELHLNVTLNRTSYTTPGSGIEQTMPTASPFMFKGYYVHHLTPAFSASLLGKYFHTRPRNEEFDAGHTINEDLEGYTTFDTTLAYAGAEPMQLRFSIKNLFGENVRYPSYYNHHPYGLPRERRHFLWEASYTF